MLKRYWFLYLEYFKINIKSILVYKLDLGFGVISIFLKNAMKFLVILFVFRFIHSIKGWTLDQVLFLYGFSTTGYAIWHCFFINTISLSYYINTGTFDRFLLRPISPIFQISMDSFDEDGWGELAFGVILLGIAIIRLKLFDWSLLALPVLLISSALIYTSISLLGSGIAFFTIGNTNLSTLAMDLHEFSKYPLSIYNTFFKILFTTIIPIGFVAYYPSVFFVNHSGVLFLLVSPLVSVLFLALSCFLWSKMLTHYSSSGN